MQMKMRKTGKRERGEHGGGVRCEMLTKDVNYDLQALRVGLINI